MVGGVELILGNLFKMCTALRFVCFVIPEATCLPEDGLGGGRGLFFVFCFFIETKNTKECSL